MIVNADLHIHSKYSGATSKDMTLGMIAREANQKGIQIMATGDCLHPEWLKQLKSLKQIDEGTYEFYPTRFVLSVEVEDNSRVHHLLYFPSISSAESFRDKIRSFSKNIDTDGRPNVALSGEDIAIYAKDVEALIGPAHAFTPWTSIYAHHDMLEHCYGSMAQYISFVELGLSADTNYADKIEELHRLTFLTNSDSHSPHPVRLAREFTRFKVKEPTYTEITRAILRSGGNKPILNVGLPPQEGKYNESACLACHTHYSLDEANRRRWKCNCGKKIKKGVKDRIAEMSSFDAPNHPAHRPEYIHLVPLAEIIAKAVGIQTPFAKTVMKRWGELVNSFDNEIKVLLETDYDDLLKVTTPAIVDAVKAFREQRIIIVPGGGGLYGHIELPGDDSILTVSIEPQNTQTTLMDYA
jgi:uncharacterized protein (TIGR00375 family)